MSNAGISIFMLHAEVHELKDKLGQEPTSETALLLAEKMQEVNKIDQCYRDETIENTLALVKLLKKHQL